MKGKTLEYLSVYKNLIICLKNYRNWNIISGEVKDDEFNVNMNATSYFSITAETPNNELAYVVILADNKNIKKAVNFKSILTKQVSKKIDKKYDGVCIMFVTEVDFGNNIKTVVTNYLSNELKGQSIYLEVHLFSTFIIEMPKHIAVYHHEIAPNEEVDYLLKTFRINKKQLPLIYNTDSGAAWIGGRPGQIIKITVPSETSGQAIRYRLVKSK